VRSLWGREITCPDDAKPMRARHAAVHARMNAYPKAWIRRELREQGIHSRGNEAANHDPSSGKRGAESEHSVNWVIESE